VSEISLSCTFAGVEFYMSLLRSIIFKFNLNLFVVQSFADGAPSQRTIEILPEGVGDFPVLHFLPVFDFISHFYQLFLVSCLFMYF
jgi:hypothetical protein